MAFTEFKTIILIFFMTLAALKISLPIFTKYFIDKPTTRASHYKPKPTGAGIILSTISTIFFLSKNYYVPLISYPISILGLIDDAKNISVKKRFSLQFLTVTLIYFLSPLAKNIFELKIIYALLISFILLIFFTGIINFINFMDGLDGLVAACMLITTISISIFFNSYFLILFGSLLAFLFFNWPPAKIFMGDAGSLYIGSILVTVACNSESIKESLLSLLAISPLILDATSCLLKRFIYKENIFKAHKKHLYQRLHIAGWSHKRVTTIYLIASVFILIGILLWGIVSCLFSLPLIVFLGVILDKLYAAKFNERFN